VLKLKATELMRRTYEEIPDGGQLRRSAISASLNYLPLHLSIRMRFGHFGARSITGWNLYGGA